MNTPSNFGGKQFAVFDIDGTLYRWQFFHDLASELARSGSFAEDTYLGIDQRFNAWRAGDISYDDYEMYVVRVFRQFLPQVRLSDYEQACHKVAEASKHKSYYYPRKLIKNLKSEGYVVIAISGSQQEILDKIAPYYEFDIVVGVVYEKQADRFTGNITRTVVGRKAELLQEIIAEYQLDQIGSIAIGDSDGDASLLELVERPIAFNPASGLLKRAQAEGWDIVIERKNIAYRLEKNGASFVLAETIIY